MVEMARAHGIDVSHHHPVRDWNKLAAQGFQIFGAKATNGLATDETFVGHREGARRLPFDLVLHYHFPTPKSGAVAQAQHFVDLVTGGGLRPNEMLALDVEYDESHDWCPDLRFTDDFVQELLRLVGDRRQFVYTGERIWKEYLKSPSWPNAIATDLWTARYGPHEPELPVDAQDFPIWPKWTLWQDSETYLAPGVDGPCDHSVFNGTPDELRAYMQR